MTLVIQMQRSIYDKPVKFDPEKNYQNMHGLIRHKLISQILLLFDDDGSQNDICMYMNSLSYDIINGMSKQIKTLEVKNRVEICKVIQSIQHETSSTRDRSLLYELVDLFATCIENEEGWGDDEYDEDDDDEEDSPTP